MGRHRSGPRRHGTKSQPVVFRPNLTQLQILIMSRRARGVLPAHVYNGFPHVNDDGFCLCLGPCCFGDAGCCCRDCSCDWREGGEVGHQLIEKQRKSPAKYGECFACGDLAALTRVLTEYLCSECKSEFEGAA